MVIAVASPFSAPATAGRPHPTYKQMILQALTELREPNGSGRRAIAKYILGNFSGLPARHDALLSVHLRRLRSQGLLLMSGHSYLISASAPTDAPHQRRGRGRPPKIGNPTFAAAVKRGPGRPRKNTAPSLIPVRLPRVRQGPGRPRKNSVPVASSAAVLGVKRGPGRPRKNDASPVAPPPASGGKRGVGRPRKNATPVAPLGSSVAKRAPGRPHENVDAPIASPPPSGLKRSRKNATPVVPPAAVLGAKRGRGRPPKNASILSTAPDAKRRAGSPHKVAISVASMPSGKARPGRPRKAAMPAGKRKPGRPHKSSTAGALEGSSENVVIKTSVAVARRGRGRPPKAMLPALGGIASPAVPLLVGGKRKRGQTCKGRRPGRPTKDKPLQSGSVLPGNTAFTKRGPGRPRKDRPLEAGASVAAKVEAGTIEDGCEAEHTQTVGESGSVRNGGEVRGLQSGGASSVEKKGPGRPRKEVPLKTEHRETGIAVLVEKRGRGRPKKEKPSEARPAETGDANNRGRGTPRPISFKLC
ncbi:hypothetical protein GUJ93_ZPchr0005g14250 [Zizania palustris]|uniref:H15 domain-containing protein n=1 Tax=Zizania palustris TaxID=103762 RepID=A0A8J5W124_ZIZPA|nr:hypothetical protein GUJ93_ZPchr0005g14250 [Zizania palustris]